MPFGIIGRTGPGMRQVVGFGIGPREGVLSGANLGRQRNRASSIDDFKGWVNLRLNYRLKGYFSRRCDMTQFTLTYSIM